MLNKFDQHYACLSRKTYEQMTQAEFKLYCIFVGFKLKEELKKSYGVKFATLLHDCFTAASKSDIVGVFIVFIDHEWNYVILPLIFVVNDDSHSVENVARVSSDHVRYLYDVDLSSLSRKAGSDTANAAKAVAKHLIEGGLNDDCEMHLANLILSYGSGLRKNYCMKVPEGQPEGTTKTRTVVTEGGAFPDGKLIQDKVS